MCGLFVDEISTIVWLKECDFHDCADYYHSDS